MLDDTETDELIVQKKINAAIVFAPGGTDKILAEITEKVNAHEADVLTAKGRKSIRSLNRRLASSKTFMLDQKKKHTSDKREEISKINEEGNKIVDGLQALQDKVMAPVLEFEEKEVKRVEQHEGNIQTLKDYGRQAILEWDTVPFDIMKGWLVEIEEKPMTEEYWEEFQATALEARDESVRDLKDNIAKRQKYIDDQAELVKHREAEETRKEDERKEELRKEGEERAKEEAKKEADKKTEDERIAKEEAEGRANKAESDKKEAEEKAEREKVEASKQTEKDKKEAAEQAEKDKQKAIDDERNRQEDEKRKERKDEEARANDERIIKAIHNSALCDLAKIEGVTEELGKRILTRIANNGITNVFIKY